VSIAEEQEDALVKSSMSGIVKESRDCATSIFDAQGRTVAQSASLPIHLGTLISSVPEILKEFPIQDMKEGDVYIANDPYAGGTHVWDVTFVVPVICQGEVAALAASIAHHIDMGAMTPGVPSCATSLYQEGLNLPPLKFHEAGKPVKVVHDIIRKNIRVPDLVLGDMGAQVAAGNVGKARMLELFNEYGKDVVLAAMEQLLAHSEALTRHELEKIPDGSWTGVDYMDNDGIDLDRRIKIQATVTIKGSDFIVDFAGSSPQAKGSINSAFASTYSVIAYALKVITGGSAIPNNEGCFRPIKYSLPPCSVVNPYPPAACGARAVTVQAMISAIYAALAKVVPERVTACSGPVASMMYLGGYNQLTDEEYVINVTNRVGMGARATKDGIDATSLDLINTRAKASEVTEMDSPFIFVASRLCPDSGGPGEYRGGLGLEWVFKLVNGSNATVTCRGERYFVPTWGLMGGLPGAPGRGFIIRKTGEKVEIPSKGDYELYEGDEVHSTAAGGGGYGDPLKRKPEFVLQDVLDGNVSLKAAANDYGAIINEESMTINWEKTAELRKEKARLRGTITWKVDRGPELGKE